MLAFFCSLGGALLIVIIFHTHLGIALHETSAPASGTEPSTPVVNRMGQYEKISEGMTGSQVRAILGKPALVASSSKWPTATHKVYIWLYDLTAYQYTGMKLGGYKTYTCDAGLMVTVQGDRVYEVEVGPKTYSLTDLFSMLVIDDH